jgi:hypothetical protein
MSLKNEIIKMDFIKIIYFNINKKAFYINNLSFLE